MGSARQKYLVKVLFVFCYEQLADVTFFQLKQQTS